MLHRLEKARAQRAENAEVLEKIERELDDQRLKLDRAQREIRIQLQEIRARHFSEEFMAAFERDISLQELESRNNKALNMVIDLANSDENGTEIMHYILRKGIKMPTHLKRTRSCISWSSSEKSSQMQDAGSYISVKGKTFLGAPTSARSTASELSSTSLKDDSSTTSLSGVSIISLELPEMQKPKKKSK